MGDLAELLVLLHDAESPFASVHARYRLWRHRERGRAAFLAGAMAERRGRGLIHSGGEADQAPEIEETVEVWRRGRDHVRVEHSGGERDGALAVQAGELWWRFDPRTGATSNVEDPSLEANIGDELGVLLAPRALLGPLRFAVLDRSSRLGRPVFVVDAWPRTGERPGLLRHMEIHALGAAADRFRLEIDTERGLVLFAQAFAGKEAFQESEALQLELDGRIADECFTFQAPEGEKVRLPGDERHLRRFLSIPEAQATAPFPVLIPKHVPAGWSVVHCAYAGPSERPPSGPSVTIQYRSESAHEDLVLSLSPANGRPDPAWLEGNGWELIDLDGHTAYLAGKGEGHGPQSQLRVERDGTSVLMMSPTLSGQQLVKLARTLASAPSSEL